MQNISRADGAKRVVAASLVVTGAVSFLVGTLLADRSHAAPAAVLELDANVRSDGATDWAHTAGATGSGGVFAGGVFVGTTTPPVPPALTAAMAADTAVLASGFSVDPLSSDATACGTGDPTVFTGAGSEKNGDRLDTMTFGTSSVPPKDEVSNVYALALDRGTTTEVLFGAERVTSDGDSHVDFEFLQGDVRRDIGCGGALGGDRSQGDLLVTVDFTRGGALAGRRVYEWHCRAEGDPAGQPATGTVCNPPAHGPSVPHYADVTTSPSVNANVTVVANAAGPVACGGWACRSSSGGQVSMLPANTFLEGGIDLGGAGFTGCTATLLVHTRTSDVFDSTLKDFVGPVPFDTCPVTLPTTTTSTTSTTLAPTTTTTSTTSTTLAPTTTTTSTTSTTLAPTTTTTSTTSTTLAPTTTTTTPTTSTTLAPTTTTTTLAPITTTDSTTLAPATTTTSTPPPPVVAGQVIERPPVVAPAGAESYLPRTGSTVKPLLVLAVLVLMAGGALVLVSRPRNAED